MNRRILSLGLASLTSFALALACSGEKTAPGPSGADKNNDAIADDLGNTVDNDGDGYADTIDINKDGIPDGPGVDTNGDGIVDALALDTDCDGLYESIDVNGDGVADYVTGLFDPVPKPGCSAGLGAGGSNSGNGGTGNLPAAGTGNVPSGGTGAVSNGGTGNTPSGGTGNTPNGGTGNVPSGGSGNTGGSGGNPTTGLGNAQYQGSGISTDRYAEGEVFRNGVGYRFIANGWGCNWQNHNITWKGTSFTITSLNGSQGGSGCQYGEYSPAGYPTVFCGYYSEKQSPGQCGLPVAINSVQSIKTGWRWKAGSGGQYNAAWDIWLGNGNSLSSYLMVWLRDPPGQQPAGAAATAGATIPGLPGTWSIWVGNVNGKPIVNYVRAEGDDLYELEFDVKELYNDAIKRNYNLPGNQFLAVAIGFEVWNGPVSNLASEDFYVEVK